VIVGDALGTIILAIEDIDPWSLYEEFGESTRRTYAQSGGHQPWVRDSETARRFLSKGESKAIHSRTAASSLLPATTLRRTARGWT
jgi:hypothetical protein